MGAWQGGGGVGGGGGGSLLYMVLYTASALHVPCAALATQPLESLFGGHLQLEQAEVRGVPKNSPPVEYIFPRNKIL